MSARRGSGIVLAGGGTAGHVYPGLELLDQLASRGLDLGPVTFTGTGRGSGADIVRDAGYDFLAFDVEGLDRKRPLENIAILARFAMATRAATSMLKARTPSVVVGLGGYSSLPVLIAAFLRRIPRTILQEDATLGISNRVASWLCNQIGVAFPAPAEIFGRKGSRVRPAVRSSIARIADHRDSGKAKQDLDLPGERSVVVFVGGSLGAAPINDAALGAYDKWRSRADLSVVHVCGDRFDQECENRLDAKRKASDSLMYRLIPFEPRFDRLLEAADIAVTRGGATTIGELAASGTPAVVVPSSYVTANHQEPNARALERAGGCRVILDSEIAGLADEIEELLNDPAGLAAMGAAGPRAVEASKTFADVVARVGGLE